MATGASVSAPPRRRRDSTGDISLEWIRCPRRRLDGRGKVNERMDEVGGTGGENGCERGEVDEMGREGKGEIMDFKGMASNVDHRRERRMSSVRITVKTALG
ncbi:hypothetical protein H6P81_011644 [Aristolochia fimbriata]|uniref:Uncharacterized protein n=1 Tax=Aristolochia fimbriata TaxID=158543 RepID=A0AAV7ECL6_ARIFI|nr:hypothetical protein H6P81_011644 [Aristolochia fimbriata]